MMHLKFSSHTRFVPSIILILCIVSCKSVDDWTPLLDKDLSQWESYLSFSHDPLYNGEAPVDEYGEIIEPLGYNVSNNVFTVIEENGESVLKVSGEVYGCVYTKQEFDNYHFMVKVKWGEKKWEPRLNYLKDSGILYHSVGPAGIDFWRSWMLSQEFQIMEGHMGDFWSIANSAIEIRAFIPEGSMNAVASAKQPFIALGSGTDLDGFCLRSADYESPDGEWTTVELVCFEGKSLHIVNGHVVMILQNSHYVENGKSFPLTRGKIQIQSEAAEVFYKEIKIKNLLKMPLEYASYFNEY